MVCFGYILFRSVSIAPARKISGSKSLGIVTILARSIEAFTTLKPISVPGQSETVLIPRVLDLLKTLASQRLEVPTTAPSLVSPRPRVFLVTVAMCARVKSTWV